MTTSSCSLGTGGSLGAFTFQGAFFNFSKTRIARFCISSFSVFTRVANCATFGGSKTCPAHFRRTRTVVLALFMLFLFLDRADGEDTVMRDSTSLDMLRRVR